MADLICMSCVDEPGLRAFVDTARLTGECAYCQQQDVKVAAAQEVVELIAECVSRHFEDPVHGVHFDSAEGGYTLPLMDSRELLEKLGLDSVNDRLLEEAIDELDGIATEWVETDPYSSRYNEQLMYDWAEFADQVKHVTRHTFFRAKVDHLESGDTAVEQPYQVMILIGGVIQRLKAFRTVKKGDVLFRARKHPTTEDVGNAISLGPAPRTKRSKIA
jgi:hypothetical protein